MKITRFLLLSFFAAISSAASAQIAGSRYFVPTPFPASPTSEAFIKYGDYKVSCFTGVPDISIPLYTIKSGSLEVPVTLSYHASGIKVSETASWVGLGWSLSAGGSITRKIVGMPDDDSGGLLDGTWRNINTIDLNATESIEYCRNVVLGMTDSRPDIFSYDFPGHSGKFFFDGNNGLKPALVPFAPISIVNTTFIPHSPGSVPNVPKFTVTDEHGTVCKFGYTGQEVTSTTTSTNTSVARTGWMLEKMISQNRRDTISFNYVNQGIDYPSLTTEYDVITDNIFNSGPSPYVQNYTQGAHNNSLIYTSVTEKDPSQIFFKNGKIEFQLDGTARQDLRTTFAYGLSRIKVYAFDFNSRNYRLQKSIVFYKSYFTPNRLRLDSIQVLDAAGAIMQHFRFTYNTSIALPYYDSFAKDYWDYYNGKTNSDSMIPNMVINSTSQGVTRAYTIGSSVPNNRNPDSTYMQACMLTGIYYPTGGHTDFTYQTNTYKNDQGTTVAAGGLRISSIKSYDGTNPTPIVKTYQYNQARFNSTFQYSYFMNTQVHRYWGSCANQGVTTSVSGTENYTSISSNPANDLTPYDASIVVYPSVTEYTGTPGSNVGKTLYLFRDIADSRQTSRSGYPLVQSNFYARGQLVSQSDFLRKSDGTYQLVKKDSMTYTAFPQNNHENAGITVDKMSWDEGPCPTSIWYYDANSGFNPNAQNQFVVQNYSIPSDDNYETNMTSYLYDQTDPTKFTTSAVNKVYGNLTHQQVSQSSHTDSKGNINISRMKYPADYLSGSSTGNIVLDSMLNKNMQAEVIEKWDSVRNITSGVNSVTAAQLNLFRQYGMVIVQDKVMKLRVAAPLTNFIQSSIFSGNVKADTRYQQMISFDDYDYQANLIRYTARNSAPVSIVWDYNNALPVAQIKNALASNGAYTSFEAGGKGGWAYSGQTAQDISAPTGQIVYPLANGAISVVYVDGAKNYLLSYWSNGGAASVFAGSFAPGTALRTLNGWTYFEHKIPSGFTSLSVSGSASIDELALYPQDAQITTYTYNSNGLANLSDTKGVITSFEYDPFQRLKNIKDGSGNIMKNYGYHNYDMTVGNDAINTPLLTRNNCPAGTNPTSTTFTVSAGKYLSSTKASANAEAQYDHDVNGQAYANKTCACQVAMISFTLTNNTGLSGLQATFSGDQTLTFNFPASGSTTVQIPAGTYSLQLPPKSPFNPHTWQLGSRPPVTAPSANFSNVIIGTGSSDSFVSVN